MSRGATYSKPPPVLRKKRQDAAAANRYPSPIHLRRRPPTLSAEQNGALSAGQNGVEIAPARGKLGVLLVGLGAVSTTFIAGVEAIKRGLAEPVGSLTQMGAIRLGKRTENRNPLIKE